MKMKVVSRICVMLALAGLIPLPRVNGGTQVLSGREPHYWDGPPPHAVVLARVYSEAEHVKGADSPHFFEMTIEPLATLAGKFDPSENAKLRVEFYV